MTILKVMDKPCNQCLFTENKIVSDKRQIDIIQGCVQNGTHFECHKATIAGTNHVCRNYYDKRGQHSQMIRIAERMGAVEFSNPENQDE